MNNYIIVSAHYPPHVGGVDRYSKAIATELARRGNHVYVITSQYGELSPKEKVSDHLTLLRVPSLMLLDGRMPVLRPSARWWAVKRQLRQIENPRVIIQTFLYPLSYAVRRLVSRMNWDSVLINHGSNYVCQGSGIIDRAEHVYEEIMARMITRKTKGCYSVSREAERWASHFSIRTAGILHNGVNAVAIEDKLKILPYGVREQYSIGKDTFVIAFVGRMIPEKGIFQLIEAIQRLLNEGCDVALIAVGGGEELDKARESTVPGRIVFTDNVSYDDVFRILRESDCCCLPSNSEGLPTVLLEAALANCFLICSPYGGSPEIVDNLGIVMEDNSQDSIYRSIIEAMQMDDRQSLIELSKQRVKRYFVWDRICDELEKIDWK